MRYRFTVMVLAPTIGVSLLLLVVGSAAAWYAHRMNRDLSDTVGDRVAGVIAAQNLLDELRDLRSEVAQFADSGDPVHLGTITALAPKITRLLDATAQTATTPESKLVCDQVGDRISQFRKQLEQLASPPNDNSTETELAHELVRWLDDDLLTSAARLTDYRENAAIASSQRNRTVASRIGIGILLLGICGSVSGLLAGYGIARAINRSVMQLSVPVRDMAGELDQVVGPITVSSDADLTELEEAMQTLSSKTADVVRSLQESHRQTMRAEQLAAVGQLAAGMAHEIRNPLTSLKLLVQTARERTAADGLQERDLAVMEEEIDRQEKILQTFLDFARPPLPNITALNITELIDKTVQAVRPRATQQGVEIVSECGELPVIDVDESQLRQVLLNLLLNALDALPEGGHVWIRATSVNSRPTTQTDGDVKNDELLIRISDDGSGLPAEEPCRIFEPFVSTKATGTGLGLSISNRIAEAHGGEITAGNRAEGGAEFTLRLPFRGGAVPVGRAQDPV